MASAVDKWQDYWERRSKIHTGGSRFSDCNTHCQCCKERIQVIFSSVEWHWCCYVQFSIFSCAQNNECQQNLGEVWNSWTPDILVYRLEEIFGTEKSRALLKAHILTGCDVTSKIESKSAAFKSCQGKYLYDFGETFHNYHFQMADKYLVQAIEPNIAAESFDDLRYVIYTTRKTSFPETFSKVHLLRPYYFINICFNIFATS